MKQQEGILATGPDLFGPTLSSITSEKNIPETLWGSEACPIVQVQCGVPVCLFRVLIVGWICLLYADVCVSLARRPWSLGQQRVDMGQGLG